LTKPSPPSHRETNLKPERHAYFQAWIFACHPARWTKSERAAEIRRASQRTSQRTSQRASQRTSRRARSEAKRDTGSHGSSSDQVRENYMGRVDDALLTKSERAGSKKQERKKKKKKKKWGKNR
jgi:hypothetical protein